MGMDDVAGIFPQIPAERAHIFQIIQQPFPNNGEIIQRYAFRDKGFPLGFDEWRNLEMLRIAAGYE